MIKFKWWKWWKFILYYAGLGVKIYGDYHIIVAYIITFLFELSWFTFALLLLDFHVTGVLIFKWYEIKLMSEVWTYSSNMTYFSNNWVKKFSLSPIKPIKSLCYFLSFISNKVEVPFISKKNKSCYCKEGIILKSTTLT